MRPVLLPTLLIRIVRQLPAFGIGGVMNTSLVHRGRDRPCTRCAPCPASPGHAPAAIAAVTSPLQLAAISPASPRRQYYAKPRAAIEPDDAGPWAHYGGDPLLTAHRRRVMDTYTARLDGALDLLGEEARPISRQSPRTLPLDHRDPSTSHTHSAGLRSRSPAQVDPATVEAADGLRGLRLRRGSSAAAAKQGGRLRRFDSAAFEPAQAGTPSSRSSLSANCRPARRPARHVGRAPQGLATCVFPSPAQALQPHSSPLTGLLGDGRDVPDVDQDLVAKLQRLNSVEANQSA